MRQDFKTMIYKETGNIGYICLNLPPANKMIPDFLTELPEVICKYALKTKMAGIIIYGNGRHFSSGADIKELLNFINATTIIEYGRVIRIPNWYRDCKKSLTMLHQMEIPVISAIRGFCVGSGLELALSSHIRIGETGSRLGLPETTFGLIPGVNGTLRLSEETGFFHSFEWIVRGNLLTANEAEKLGAIDLLVPKKSSLEYAKKFIEFISQNNYNYKFTERFLLLEKFKENTY